MSPSTLNLFAEFEAQFPTTEIVYYDSISFAGMRMANNKTFERPAIPSYRFDKAEVIVGFNRRFSWRLVITN